MSVSISPFEQAYRRHRRPWGHQPALALGLNWIYDDDAANSSIIPVCGVLRLLGKTGRYCYYFH